MSTEMALLYLGAIVTVASSLVLVVRISPERETEERRVMERVMGRGMLAVAPAYAKRVPMALYSEAWNRQSPPYRRRISTQIPSPSGGGLGWGKL